MAKKTRTPTPPRRVQAPQRRAGGEPPSEADRRRRLLLYGLAGSGILLLAAVVLGFVLIGGDSGDGGVKAKMAAIGCTLNTYPAQERPHRTTLPKGFKYNSDPPTSGPHNPQAAIFGAYEEPLDRMQTIHNLEHGGILIQYGSRVPQATRDELQEFYNDDPNGLLMGPLPSLGRRIALGAWTSPPAAPEERNIRGEGHLASCTRFEGDAYEAFRDAYRAKGPERFPLEALAPGS